MNLIIEAKENSTGIDIVYLDIIKAFNTVSNNELLHKLWPLGIHGRLWLWFRAYLLGRSQSVHINQAISWLLPVISRVPQGSIWDTAIYNLHKINDFPEVLKHVTVYLFADDTKCIYPSHTLMISDQIVF